MNADFGQISRGVTDFKPPPSNNYMRDAKTFLESNGMVAKLAFLILVLVAFVTLLRLGSILLVITTIVMLPEDCKETASLTQSSWTQFHYLSFNAQKWKIISC